MYFEIIIFLISFVTVSFCLYVLIREDVIFIRKNISMEQVFNSVFASILPGFFIARILYIIFSFNVSYLNPYVFLAFPYYPGFSLFGGVIGVLAFEFLYTARRKVPSLRFSDFYSISFLWGITITKLLVVGQAFLFKRAFVPAEGVILLLYFMFSLLFSTIALSLLRQGKLREGSVTLLFLATFSFLTFFSQLLSKNVGIFLGLESEGILAFILFLSSIVFFLHREQLALRVKK